VGCAVVGLVFCIEQVVRFVVVVLSIEDFVVFAVVVVIHLPILWLIKEGFGKIGQPVNTSGGNQIKINL
jgi:hypothetical protein